MSNLILTRRPGEAIVIKDTVSGNLIELTILGINRNQIKVSIVAPSEVEVDRLEIFKMKNAA